MEDDQRTTGPAAVDEPGNPTHADALPADTSDNRGGWWPPLVIQQQAPASPITTPPRHTGKTARLPRIVGVCDAAGRLVDFLLVAGQAHELAPSLTLLKRLPEAPDWALADMACDAQEFRNAVRAMDAIPVVPSRRNAREPHPARTTSTATAT